MNSSVTIVFKVLWKITNFFPQMQTHQLFENYKRFIKLAEEFDCVDGML